MDFFSKLFGGGNKNKTTTTQNDIRQLPDYAEATGARASWWDTLQRWAGEPGFGAIQPDWSSIWDNARGKVQRYFEGGPEGPGLNAKIRANNARRGVSEQPAADALLQRSGFQQGNMLQDLAVQQATKQADLSESGRKTWLQSLMGLAGLKPSFQSFGSRVDTKYEPTDILADGGAGILENVAGTGSSGFGGLDQLLGPLMSMFGGGGSGPSGIGSVAGGGTSIGGGNSTYNPGYAPVGMPSGGTAPRGGGGDIDWGQLAIQAIPMLVSMFCWVAAEIFEDGMYGAKTSACRHYIGNIGPKWFKRFYVKHGESFAAFIHDKPIIKAILRPLFEYFAWRGRESVEVVYG